MTAMTRSQSAPSAKRDRPPRDASGGRRSQAAARPANGVEEEGYASFVVPEGVGGRFSVLSPVGLLSAALVGIDIRGLAAGAADMDARCRQAPFEENPALVYAAIQWLMQSEGNKNIAVTFAYSQRLRDLADWYAQLLAESIGKRHSRDGQEVFVGPTPVRAVGVTDQLSQVQLYAEGPADKWFTFLSVENSDHTITIPEAYSDRDALAYLGGRTLNDLFEAEREGTRIALTEAGRPEPPVVLEPLLPGAGRPGITMAAGHDGTVSR